MPKQTKKEVTLNEALKSQVHEDSSIMEKFLKEDGEVPPVLFVHFDKPINKKIDKLMNRIASGPLAVKNGLFIALTEPGILTDRRALMYNLGTCFALLHLLKVIDAPKSIVFCAEAYTSKVKDLKKLNALPPSKDPNAKDVYMSVGIHADGDSYFRMQEVNLKMAKKGTKYQVTVELLPVDLAATMGGDSTPSEFFNGYNENIEKLKEDKEYRRFIDGASSDPDKTFEQALNAAFIITKLQAIGHQ